MVQNNPKSSAKWDKCTRRCFNNRENYLQFISIDLENDYEVAFTNLIINGITLKIVIAYRPPSQTPIENQVLHDKLSTSNKFILVGDFNYPSFIMTIIPISHHILLTMIVI